MILATSRLSFEDLPMATELCVSSVRLGRPVLFFMKLTEEEQSRHTAGLTTCTKLRRAHEEQG